MIRIENLEVRFQGFALGEINLSIEDGEFFILMGPTGAGKTVLLEALAGLIPIKGGRILLKGKDITRLPPEKRGITIVYQDHALFPHLTVIQNIRYGLHFHKVASKEADRRLEELLQELDLEHLRHRLPVNLSGGESQRVALARALMVKPAVLLLDEPLSALDSAFREEVRHGLKRVHQSSRATFLMVTHDFAEALALGDRAAVINRGKIEQIGPMPDVFHRPATEFVANFVGMKNTFPAAFDGAYAVIEDGLHIVPAGMSRTGRGYVAIRPEEIVIHKNPITSSMRNSFRGRIIAVLDQGFYSEIHIQVGTVIFKTLITKKSHFEMEICEDVETFLSFEAASVHTF